MPRFSTLAVHAGRAPDDSQAVATPLHLSSTFHLTEAAYDAVHDPSRLRQVPFYTRYGNPNQRTVAGKLARLEGAEDALVFSSGMAAITSTLRALLEPGDTLVVARSLYGGADSWIDREMPRLRVTVKRVALEDLQAVRDALEGAKLFYFEPVSNPLLEVADVPALTSLARAAGVLTVVDNTFLSPANFRPLEHGVDLVLHSGTKYLNGHTDVVAGLVAGPRALMDRIWSGMMLEGGCLDPHAAWLLERGMKTLELRMNRHNENGLAVARALVGHPAVVRVFYPGLAGASGYDIARRLYPGRAGGMVSLEVRGGETAAARLLERLDREGGPFTVAGSLGGVESLVSMSARTSHPRREVRERMGIPDGLVRMSLGIEDAQDLIEALIEALEPEMAAQ